MSGTALRALDDAIRAIHVARAAFERSAEGAITAAAVQNARLLRTRYFAADLFSEPAWDILLEIAAREDARKQVSVSSVSLFAGIPSTTGLRHIDRLCALGLIDRVPDRSDQRRVWLRLTAEGRDALDRYLLAASKLLALAQ